MLQRVSIRNFKRFRDLELDLGNPVVFVGPNNSGKSSVLQAIALWNRGITELSIRRNVGEPLPPQRPGVVVNRREFTAIPVPNVSMLWPHRHVVSGKKGDQRRVRIEVVVEGEQRGQAWEQGVQVDYANPESVNVRPLRDAEGHYIVHQQAVDQKVAYLMPMSGLTDREYLKEPGQVDAEIGQGRTADVLRNLLFLVEERGDDAWGRLNDAMDRLFGVRIREPDRDSRAELHVRYVERGSSTELDLACAGRGMQQTLLVFSWLYLNQGGALLLDEPDAHLEVLRQRETWMILRDEAERVGSQIIAATHSEKLLEHVAATDVVVAFLGKPHRIDDRGSQLRKALTDISFEDYFHAEERRWVLYVESESDLAILRAFAQRLAHPAKEDLDRVFVKSVGNVLPRAREHFYGLREAVPDLSAVAIIDQTPKVALQPDGAMRERMWRRREIENYLATPGTLLAWARAQGGSQGELFSPAWESKMLEAIHAIESAKSELGEQLWSPSDLGSRQLEQVMQAFYRRTGAPSISRKRNWYELAAHVPDTDIDPEVIEALDLIHDVASASGGRRSSG